jgi:hypothetical protein
MSDATNLPPAAAAGQGPDQKQLTWAALFCGKDPQALAAPPAAAKQAAPKDGGSILDSIEAGLSAAKDKAVGGVESLIEDAKEVGKTVVEGVEAGLQAVSDRIVQSETADYEAAMKNLDGEIKNVKDAGLDPGHYEAQAKEIRAAFEEAQKLDGKVKRIAAFSNLAKRANEAAMTAKEDVARLSHAAVEGVGSAITKLRDGAKQSIDKLDKKNKQKPELAKRLDDLDKLIAEAGKITDRAERARKLKVVNVDAESLFGDAAQAAGDQDIVQKVYADALKERYGFAISNPSGMKNTHLDQVYKMFDKVPETDVVQGKLKTLSYTPLNDDGTKNTGAAYGGATIDMGDYGNENWGYQDPKTGKPTPANGFSISTLHELGHSVDDRFGIMNSNQGKTGAGGWRKESLKSVAKA